MTRFAVVDDHLLLAGSLAMALVAAGHEARVVPVTTLPLIRADVLADPPDVVLLDLQLGAVGHGRELVAPLTTAGVRVLVVTGVTDPLELATILEAGAVGWVGKGEPVDLLLATATRAAYEPVVPEEVRHQLLHRLRRHRETERALMAPFARLTPREEQVLEALCAGHSVAQIADNWVVSVPTVRTQVRAIFAKLGVNSQLEAVALAHDRHWHGLDNVQRHPELVGAST